MTAIFLQVRLGSHRFPRKALAELGGRTVIEHAMRALRDVTADRHVILTDAESAGPLATYASRCGFGLFVGDPHDVLGRFAAAIEWYEPATVVRATGDNPLVSADVTRAALSAHGEFDGDYTALTGSPLGTGVEVVRARALLEAAAATSAPYDREHVTPFLYRHPERFRLHIEPVRESWRCADVSVTLDTPADHARLEEIFEELYAGAPIGIDALVSHLSRRAPGVQSTRRHSA
ncbi:MAG: cytidylyltransferase domain-containing protein [Spirochaetota bacterium]